jgi:hypothetical protein
MLMFTSMIFINAIKLLEFIITIILFKHIKHLFLF